jgi:hypothetical protein
MVIYAYGRIAIRPYIVFQYLFWFLSRTHLPSANLVLLLYQKQFLSELIETMLVSIQNTFHSCPDYPKSMQLLLLVLPVQLQLVQKLLPYQL